MTDMRNRVKVSARNATSYSFFKIKLVEETCLYTRVRANILTHGRGGGIKNFISGLVLAIGHDDVPCEVV